MRAICRFQVDWLTGGTTLFSMPMAPLAKLLVLAAVGQLCSLNGVVLSCRGEQPTNAALAALMQGGRVVALDSNTWRVGSVILNKAERTIQIPSHVNMQSNVIEYALVTVGGKTHESLFATEANPRDVHIAALLLGIRPAEMMSKTNLALSVPAGSAVEVEGAWLEGGREIRRPLHELIGLADKPNEITQLLKPSPWFYNGSRVVDNGLFLAEQGGSIISLIFDPDALINNPRADKDNDDIHFPNTSQVPPAGTPVRVYLKLPRTELK